MNPLGGMFQEPEQKRTFGQKAMNVVRNFGAGLAGFGPEFIAMQRQEQQQLDEQRQKAMAKDAMTVYQLLNDNKIDDAISLVDRRVQYISELGGDPTDTLEIRQMLTTPGRLDEARQELGLFVQASMENGLLPVPERKEPIRVGANDRLFDPNTFEEIVSAAPAAQEQEPAAVQSLRIRAAEAGLQPGTQPYVDFMLSGGGGSGVNVTTNVQQPGADKYVEGRATAQATQAAELEKAAESAYRSNQALDRFIESSASGDAGAAQPVITGVKNLLSSFGINPEGLTDTLMMEQAIGDILANRMSELGARGLTDRDMQVLRESLPRVATSHEARVMVANVIQKANMSTLRDYSDLVSFEQETYPDARFRRPAWLESVREQGFTVPEMAPAAAPELSIDDVLNMYSPRN